MSEREQGFPKWTSLRSLPTKGTSCRTSGWLGHNFSDLDNIEIISRPLKDIDGWVSEHIKEYLEVVEVSKQTHLNDSENYHYLNACDFYFKCSGTFICIGIKTPKQS